MWHCGQGRASSAGLSLAHNATFLVESTGASLEQHPLQPRRHFPTLPCSRHRIRVSSHRCWISQRSQVVCTLSRWISASGSLRCRAIPFGRILESRGPLRTLMPLLLLLLLLTLSPTPDGAGSSLSLQQMLIQVPYLLLQ